MDTMKNQPTKTNDTTATFTVTRVIYLCDTIEATSEENAQYFFDKKYSKMSQKKFVEAITFSECDYEIVKN